jgi:hypothetical protein
MSFNKTQIKTSVSYNLSNHPSPSGRRLHRQGDAIALQSDASFSIKLNNEILIKNPNINCDLLTQYLIKTDKDFFLPLKLIGIIENNAKFESTIIYPIILQSEFKGTRCADPLDPCNLWERSTRFARFAMVLVVDYLYQKVIIIL